MYLSNKAQGLVKKTEPIPGISEGWCLIRELVIQAMESAEGHLDREVPTAEAAQRGGLGRKAICWDQSQQETQQRLEMLREVLGGCPLHLSPFFTL